MIRRHRSASRRGAFTLMELLTVISIITLLISMLLPSVSGARKRGRMTVCQTRLRELAAAALSYTQQNLDAFPATFDCEGGECLFWNGHQYYGWNGTTLNEFGRFWQRPINVELGLEPSPHTPREGRIAECPDDGGAPGQTGRYQSLFECLGTSYPMNPILCQGRYADWRYRDRNLSLSQVVQPPLKVLLLEHPAFGLTYDAYFTAIRPGWHDEIIPTAGAAFIDGHAEVMRGLGTIKEWQWYADADGPRWVRELTQKIDWQVRPEADAPPEGGE